MSNFRKGESPAVIPQPVVASVSSPPVSSSTPVIPSPAAPAAGVSLEWWELPQRYRREPIDDLECDAINMGAREKPYC